MLTIEAKILAKRENTQSGASVQHLQQSVRVCEDKLNRLLDMSLNGDVSTEEYTTKKRELIEEKTSLKENLKDVERKSAVWLEPLLSFIQHAKSTEKISSGINLKEKADFFRNVGFEPKIAPIFNPI